MVHSYRSILENTKKNKKMRTEKEKRKKLQPTPLALYWSLNYEEWSWIFCPICMPHFDQTHGLLYPNSFERETAVRMGIYDSLGGAPVLACTASTFCPSCLPWSRHHHSVCFISFPHAKLIKRGRCAAGMLGRRLAVYSLLITFYSCELAHQREPRERGQSTQVVARSTNYKVLLQTNPWAGEVACRQTGENKPYNESHRVGIHY